MYKYIHVDTCDSAVMSLFFRRCNLNVRWLCKGEWVTHTLCNVSDDGGAGSQSFTLA